MSWSESRIFQQFLTDAFNNTAAFTLNADTFDVALFDNSITPSNTVTAANSAYNAGVWASGGVSDASGWPAAGRALGSLSSSASSGTYTFSAANTVSANSTTTLAANYGCLVYDNTLSTPVSKQGICYNYFGGAQQVTSGQFTIAWNSNGIFRIVA